MTSVTCHGGVREIGGNKILLEDRDTRVFLDFGKSYSKEGQYFSFPQPRARDHNDLLALGLIPKLGNLYGAAKGKPSVDAVVLSHPHGDHWDYIRHLRENIPILCGETTRDVILAREKASTTSPPVAKLTRDEDKVFKDFETFRTGDHRSVGSFRVSPVHVDHSIPGSYGLLVETSEGMVAYSGDLRLHGPRRDLTEDFVDEARAADPTLLIMEGTNIGEGEISSEAEVQSKLSEVVGGTHALVLATFSPYDIDRLRTFHDVAQATGRRLALSLKQAYLLDQLREDPNLEMFSLREKDILIYTTGKRTTYSYEKIVKRKYGDSMVEAADVNNLQDEIIVPVWFHHITELIDIEPDPGSIFISSQSEPFNEEMEIDYGRLRSWLRRYGVPLYRIHASGHAMPLDLKGIIERIAPKRVMLIHTEEPELYRHFISDLGIDTILPEEGETIPL